MTAHDLDGTTARNGKVVAVALGSFVTYILIVGLTGTGRHFIELGVLRLVLLTLLVTFVRWSGSSGRRLGRVGIGLAGIGAAAYVAGGIGAVATDGWAYDVFAGDDMANPPWYAFVLGLSGIVFALGTLFVGLSGRRTVGRAALAVILAGALFPLAFALGDTAGHVAWLVPWIVAAVGLARTTPAPAGELRAQPVA